MSNRIRNDVKKFVMTSKTRHDDKNMLCVKNTYDVKKFVMTSKTHHDTKKCVMTSKTRHGVTKFAMTSTIRKMYVMTKRRFGFYSSSFIIVGRHWYNNKFPKTLIVECHDIIWSLYSAIQCYDGICHLSSILRLRLYWRTYILIIYQVVAISHISYGFNLLLIYLHDNHFDNVVIKPCFQGSL